MRRLSGRERTSEMYNTTVHAGSYHKIQRRRYGKRCLHPGKKKREQYNNNPTNVQGTKGKKAFQSLDLTYNTGKGVSIKIRCQDRKRRRKKYIYIIIRYDKTTNRGGIYISRGEGKGGGTARRNSVDSLLHSGSSAYLIPCTTHKQTHTLCR